MASAALAAMVGQAEAENAGYDWSGFYVGAQGGYVHSSADFSGGDVVSAGERRNNGFVAGIYAGHDWQEGRQVFSVLADLDYVGVDDLVLDGVDPSAPFGGKAESYTYDVDWLATARARAGYVPSERLLVYATGGLAFAHLKATGEEQFFFNTFKSSNSNVEVGGVFGLGAELALTQNWSVKTEYLHYDFNSIQISAGKGAPGFDPSLDTVKVGLSFRFGP